VQRRGARGAAAPRILTEAPLHDSGVLLRTRATRLGISGAVHTPSGGVRHGDNWRVRGSERQRCLFGAHNRARPFARLDRPSMGWCYAGAWSFSAFDNDTLLT
jgi:hypothetical protein